MCQKIPILLCQDVPILLYLGKVPVSGSAHSLLCQEVPTSALSGGAHSLLCHQEVPTL